MEIEFTTLEDRYLGRVKLVDGTLTGSSDFTKSIIEDWTSTGGSADDFIDYFSGYANQAFQAQVVTD